MSEEVTDQQPKDGKKRKKKLTKLEKWFRTLRRIHAIFMRPFFPYKKVGHTEKFNDRAYLLVGNHRSVLDVIPAALSMDKPVHFIAKNQLTKKAIGRWFTKKSEVILVNRDGTDVRAVMQAMKYLKNGESVCIFPEGTRNKTEEVFLPFKSGAAALAIKTQTPIVFIIQCKKIKAFKKSYYYYSEPFELSEFYGKKLTEEDMIEADEILRKKMLAMHFELIEMLEKKSKQ